MTTNNKESDKELRTVAQKYQKVNSFRNAGQWDGVNDLSLSLVTKIILYGQFCVYEIDIIQPKHSMQPI